jgi:NAD(P)-dependent dehydrogenase (short-subunit alcohol dehydrogenase family)
MTTRPVHVIFGAAGGIGSDLARRLHAAGADLMLAGRTAGKLEPLAAELGAAHLAADATESAPVDAVFAAAVDRFGRVDGVAHCVGTIRLKPAHLTTDEEFADTVARNLTSAFYVLRAAVRAMQANPGGPGGSVVLVSTVAANVGLANHEAIAAAKAGVQGLALSAAATYAPRSIRVNCVAPGLTRTPLSARLTGNEASLKASTAMHPLGRIGEPGDIAAAIAFLLDPANSWVTGQVLGIDGGLSTLRPRGG